MNFYGSEQFKEFEKEKEERVFSHCDMSSPYREEPIDGGYILKHYYYEREKRSPFAMVERGEICRLYKGSEFVFEWKCYDGRSHSEIIDHSNGKKYLLFNEDLYGYAVLDLETCEAVHYLPWESYQSGDSFEETFIWVNMHYDKESDLLAVEGCFWVSTYSVIVLNFKDPMKIVEKDRWVDLSDIGEGHLKKVRKNDSDDNSPHIDFVSWEKDRLVCSSFEIDKKELLDLVNNGER